MNKNKYSKESVIQLLKDKYNNLAAQNTPRYPMRSDFSDEEVVAIKAFLGPWPRALEAAGIKPPRDGDRIIRNREKRIRAKRLRSDNQKQLKKNKDNGAK